jgi:hypothetical protein
MTEWLSHEKGGKYGYKRGRQEAATRSAVAIYRIPSDIPQPCESRVELIEIRARLNQKDPRNIGNRNLELVAINVCTCYTWCKNLILIPICCPNSWANSEYTFVIFKYPLPI